MFGGAILFFGALIASSVFLAWRLGHRQRPADLPGRLRPVVAAARRRAFTAVGFALVVFFAGAAGGLLLPSLLGLPLVVAAPTAAAMGLLLYAATPPRAVHIEAGQPRSAALERRTWLSVIPRRWLHMFLTVVGLFLALVLFCGVTASTDEYGLSRTISFVQPDRSSTGGPYPGWYYGIPALIALALLVAATIIALHRIGSTAAFPRLEDSASDAHWRRSSAAVVLALSAGAGLFTAGGVALMAGVIMSNTARSAGAPVGWIVTGVGLTGAGALLLVLSVVSVTLAALTAFTIGEKLVRTPERVR